MMNFIILQGHLTDDPVYRKGQNGKNSSIWGKIGVYQGKDQNGEDLPSMFVEFVAFGNDADTLAQMAHKGDLIVASGKFSETQSQGQNGAIYNNKKITGNAKMCYKIPKQNNVNNAQSTQYQGQYMQTPQYQQVPTQNNVSMWG